MRVLHQMTPYEPDEQSIVFQDTYPVPYLHNHRETQLIWVKRGTGNAVIGNHVQPFRPGEIYVVGSNQPHLFEASNGVQESINMLCLYVDHRRIFSGVSGYIPELSVVADFMKEADAGLQVPPDYVDSTARIMVDVCNKLGLARFMSFLQLISLFIEIKAKEDWKPLSAVLDSDSPSVSDRLNVIYRYTLEHYMDQITLEEVAKLACMTPNAFCTYFKKYTRKTYFSFLNDLRIRQACEKLLRGNYPTIASVAYDCGFINTITFNRVFRRLLGMTPTEYVQKYAVKGKVIEVFSETPFY